MHRHNRISVDDADQMIAMREVRIVDIRDPDSYAACHIEQAEHLDQDRLSEFIAASDTEIPVIVCCYQGNLSQSAAALLTEQGFREVYSLDGGFAAWAARYPDACEPPL